MLEPIKEYIAIIHSRLISPLSSFEYGENHHIIPRACGGGNEKWNLVKLTPEEHYRCHELLPFIYVKGKEHKSMLCAWNIMSGRIKGAEIDQEMYGKMKREFSIVMRDIRLGTHHDTSDETRQKISESKKGKPSWRKGKHLSKEHRQRISEAHKGKHLSEEHRRRISKAREKWTPTEEYKSKMSKAIKEWWDKRRKVA